MFRKENVIPQSVWTKCVARFVQDFHTGASNPVEGELIQTLGGGCGWQTGLQVVNDLPRSHEAHGVGLGKVDAERFLDRECELE
jgi:hypothetical protein